MHLDRADNGQDIPATDRHADHAERVSHMRRRGSVPIQDPTAGRCIVRRARLRPKRGVRLERQRTRWRLQPRGRCHVVDGALVFGDRGANHVQPDGLQRGKPHRESARSTGTGRHDCAYWLGHLPRHGPIPSLNSEAKRGAGRRSGLLRDPDLQLEHERPGLWRLPTHARRPQPGLHERHRSVIHPCVLFASRRLHHTWCLVRPAAIPRQQGRREHLGDDRGVPAPRLSVLDSGAGVDHLEHSPGIQHELLICLDYWRPDGRDLQVLRLGP